MYCAPGCVWRERISCVLPRPYPPRTPSSRNIAIAVFPGLLGLHRLPRYVTYTQTPRYTWTTDVKRTPRRDSFLPSRDRSWLRFFNRVSWTDGGNPGEIARSAGYQPYLVPVPSGPGVRPARQPWRTPPVKPTAATCPNNNSLRTYTRDRRGDKGQTDTSDALWAQHPPTRTDRRHDAYLLGPGRNRPRRELPARLLAHHIA